MKKSTTIDRGTRKIMDLCSSLGAYAMRQPTEEQVKLTQAKGYETKLLAQIRRAGREKEKAAQVKKARANNPTL